MKHNYTLQGFAYRIRPVSLSDANFIIDLRTNESLNHYIHTTSTKLKDQQNWILAYYEKPDDYYFVIEDKHQNPVGLIAAYSFDASEKSCEWGRWILKPGSTAAVESAYLIYKFAFETLHLNIIYCRTVSENKAVVSFHDSCQLSSRRELKSHFSLDGVALDATEHILRAADWPTTAERLSSISHRLAQRDSK